MMSMNVFFLHFSNAPKKNIKNRYIVRDVISPAGSTLGSEWKEFKDTLFLSTKILTEIYEHGNSYILVEKRHEFKERDFKSYFACLR